MAVHPGENLGLWRGYTMPTASYRPELGRSKDPPSKPMQMADIPFPLCKPPSVRSYRMAVISHSIQENRSVFKEDPTLCVGGFYEVETGRYITPDPLGLAGGMNPYVYANANPTNFVDPLGLLPLNSVDAQLLTGASGLTLFTLIYQIGRTTSPAPPPFPNLVGGDCDADIDEQGVITRAYCILVPAVDKVGAALETQADNALKIADNIADSVYKFFKKGCFTKETLVSTKGKQKKIRDVEVGEIVLTKINKGTKVNTNKKEPKQKQRHE